MARCNDCNKFVSYDTETEPEENSADEAPDSDGVVNCEVRISNNCAECGTEMREASFDLSFDFSGAEFDNHKPQEEDEEESEHELEVSIDYERDVRTEGSGRRLRTFYTVRATAHLSCKCGWSDSRTAEDEIQASAMDEC